MIKYIRVKDLAKWCEDRELPIKTKPCNNCGKPLTANRPWVDKERGWQGLTSAKHECSPDYDLFVGIPLDPIKRNKLRAAFNEVSEGLK